MCVRHRTVAHDGTRPHAPVLAIFCAVTVWRLELQAALRRYQTACGSSPERLVSGSDDFTMFLWQPSVSKKPLQRMTGHMQLINQVKVVMVTCAFASCFPLGGWVGLLGQVEGFGGGGRGLGEVEGRGVRSINQVFPRGHICFSICCWPHRWVWRGGKEGGRDMG